MLLRTIRVPGGRVYYSACRHISSSKCLYSTRTSKTLRILFCGSDQFSCASLRAVHQEQLRDPQSIASIDVLLRPGKPSGRGLKSMRDVPIKSVAQELGLALHERDTFTGWTLPEPNREPINLIIAVSFGLKVPPRILKSAEYGGINVHPSLLPDFRGPAPLHHTLLAGETHTGVTLQTLHPEKFDHGAILAQTPPLEIPNASKCTYEELLEFITPKAAEILVQGIRNRPFILDPSRPQSTPQTPETNRPLRHAPKITTEDRRIEWTKWTKRDILRRDRVLGRLWSFCQPKGKPKTRIILEGFTDISPIASKFPWYEKLNTLAGTAYSQPQHTGAVDSPLDERDLGKFFLLPMISADHRLFSIPCAKYDDAIVIRLPNGDAVLLREITIEGGKKKAAAKAMDGWSSSGEITAPSAS